jgi:cysteine desulfurase
MIYLDNSATTKVRPEVLAAMLPYLSDRFGNPSSVHSAGREARAAVNTAREHVARLLNCESAEVYFSGCGTLSNNVALLGRARFCQANDQNKHLVVSRIEHPSVLGPAQYLESQGWKVTYLGVDREGLVDLKALARALDEGASIVSIMWANNEIGVLEPLGEIASLIEESKQASGREIFFHSDAVQVVGKVKVDMAALPLSSLSSSGHKFGAPKGIGFLFVRRLVNVMPIIFGGGQEMGLMPGTEPAANIVALGEAARLAFIEQEETEKRLQKYGRILLDALLSIEGVTVTGPVELEKRLPGHVSVAVANVEGESLVLKSDLRGVSLSSGSACHQGIIEPSSVLKAINLPADKAMGSIRLSVGKENTEAEVVAAAKLVREIFAKAAGKAGAGK